MNKEEKELLRELFFCFEILRPGFLLLSASAKSETEEFQD